MSGRVVAVVDWRAGAQLTENQRYLARAADEGRLRPREWRDGAARYRSLTVRDDGTCELQTLSAAAVARRLAAGTPRGEVRGTKVRERG